MERIVRGSGLNESERYLAKLADATFLDLWSYPNTFVDRTVNARRTGKELCDLLVVCGNDVIIFSDKAISWPGGEDVHLSWSRWFRSAVTSSVKQIRGADRWIMHHPDRIFLDSKCTVRLPIDLPPPDRLRVHGVAVATGAYAACSSHHGDPDGSMMVQSSLRGAMHTDTSDVGYRPFSIGDVDPSGPFVHVFDETALNLVMAEMDTVSDFVRYLEARQVAIRRENIAHAASEAEMMAVYLQSEDREGRHIFPTAASLGGRSIDRLVVEAGTYERLRASPAYRAKKVANRASYGWDHLIRAFTHNVLGGTSVSVSGFEQEVKASTAEPALRAMALEDRTTRRALGAAFAGAVSEAERRNKDRFARVIVPQGGTYDPLCGHVFLIMPFRGVASERGYDEYRRVRSLQLYAYCLAALQANRGLRRMLGIAIDGPASLSGREGGSEDLLLLQVDEWTPALEAEATRLRDQLNILNPARLRMSRSSTVEYPSQKPEQRLEAGNRQSRRVARSKARRGK